MDMRIYSKQWLKLGINLYLCQKESQAYVLGVGWFVRIYICKWYNLPAQIWIITRKATLTKRKSPKRKAAFKKAAFFNVSLKLKSKKANLKPIFNSPLFDQAGLYVGAQDQHKFLTF